ncbi:MAG TPA: rhodanese-like domain-containing protein [Rhizomicrobium sp.]|jgi:membrane protein DedA with SNARE-associated domain/rhodanese-related sulfurtransferase
MQTAIFLLERYGLLAIFVNVLLSTGGLPLPYYPMVILAAALAGGQSGRLTEIVLTGTLAAVMADLGWFWSGRRFGRRVLRLLCRISLSPDSCVRQTENAFARMGPIALPVSKFVPGLSSVSVVLSGGSDMPLVTFLAFDGIGAFAYIGTAAALGVMFRHAISGVLADLAAFGTFGLAGLVGGLSAYLVWKWGRRQFALRELDMERVGVEETHRLMASGTDPLILDVRSTEARRQDGYIPGSIGADAAFLERLDAGFPDREIVTYCACPADASAAAAARRLQARGFLRVRPLRGGIDAWRDAGHPIAGPFTQDRCEQDDLPCMESHTASAAA